MNLIKMKRAMEMIWKWKFLSLILTLVIQCQATDILTLTIAAGDTKTFKFDFCSVASCSGDDPNLMSADKYGCLHPDEYLCQDKMAWVCGSWTDVWWNTGVNGYTHPQSTPKWQTLQNSITLMQGKVERPCSSKTCNPLYFTMNNANKLMTGLYGVGADVFGHDPVGRFKVVVVDPTVTKNGLGYESTPMNQSIVQSVVFTKAQDIVAVETGYKPSNSWLDWVSYTANSLGKSDCYVCSEAMPTLTAAPFPGLFRDRKKTKCVLKLLSSKAQPTESECTSLHWSLPVVKTTDQLTPKFKASNSSYTCFSRSLAGGSHVGSFPYCREVHEVSKQGLWGLDFSTMTVAREHVWWTCSAEVLRDTLPIDWQGVCALAMLRMPISIVSLSPDATHLSRQRVKRSTSTPKGSFDSEVYIDAIGVPWGVPDEYKARNQIAAGFESILFSLATINKNVDWINYIYYNQQRFVNYTRDAVKGLAEQLHATSLMTWQNRVALDYLLAEKGGVCVMFGSMCCTFIPNNTAPDGSVTRALKALTSLANELERNSGIHNPFTKLLQSWFGKWADLAVSFFVAAASAVVIFMMYSCCVFPCLQRLIGRLIETASNMYGSDSQMQNMHDLRECSTKQVDMF